MTARDGVIELKKQKLSSAKLAKNRRSVNASSAGGVRRKKGNKGKGKSADIGNVIDIT